MISLKKLQRIIAQKKWKYKVSAHIGTKIRNEVYVLLHRKSVIVVDGWLVKFYKKNSLVSNWGDDINVYFLEMISGKRVVPAQALFFPKWRKKYCCIGTIIPQCMSRKSVVWGSGYGLVDKSLGFHPAEVKCVRGPLTRDFLIKNNVNCPEIYGDPALLLPLYYKPKSLPHKKVGLIPHHHDWDCEVDKKIALPDDWRMINVVGYDKWTDIIDQICSCELILSSSLHGLIVSDAYRIPNVFTEFEAHHHNYIKFQDYFLSVNRKPYKPIQYDSILDFSQIEIFAIESIGNVRIDANQIKSVCPFLI